MRPMWRDLWKLQSLIEQFAPVLCLTGVRREEVAKTCAKA